MVKPLNLMLKIGLTFLVLTGVMTITQNKFEHLKTKKYYSQPITMAERERQLVCLAKNIYFEAAQEPFEGKVAVAQVTMNRVESGKYPNDVCEVVFQKNFFYDKVVCQFSWYCESGPKIPKSATHYGESMEVAKKVLLENYRLSSLKNAFYYHADYINPRWNKPKITQIGRHIFYGERI